MQPAEFSRITQNNSHYTQFKIIQTLILEPIESQYVTFY